MSPTAVREALLRMLALIEVGWTRGRSKKMRGRRACYCISGACLEATKGAGRCIRVSTWEAIEAATPFHQNPVEYNDAPGRTKQDMVRLLKHAIKLVEPRLSGSWR